jgi:ubiquitin-conjugating enzyme E2 variant
MAWLSADLASGLAHYAADNFGSPSTPLIGKTMIQPFREHHLSPREMLKHGFLERNGNSALISLFALGWLPFVSPSPWTSPLATVALLMTLWVFLTNQIHAWAHAERAPWGVRMLQRTGLILSPEHHAVHHAPYERAADRWGSHEPDGSGGNYCITSGACDRLLRALRQATRPWSAGHPPSTPENRPATRECS